MIPPTVKEEVLRRIRAAEAEHHVRVLLAVESGSRAWGFESQDSDYDARFIYVHPQEWYLSIDERRDVIEYPIVDEIDLNGWDLRKALRLFRSSNPAFVEWIQSPLIYLEHGPFAARCRELLPELYSCARGIYHYRSMARTNFRSYLREPMVPVKKYFYVLRPLLAVRWLEAYGRPAPIEFGKLLHLIEDGSDLRADVDALLAKKRASSELGLAPQVASIHAFIETELERLEQIQPVSTASPAGVNERLNELFLECLYS